MRSDFDPIRSAPLPDSFERTAAWLREVPPTPTRRTPVAAVVLLLLGIGACSWPVRTQVASGSVMEVVTPDSLQQDHPTLQALDRLVPAGHRQLVAVEPRDADQGGGSVRRYTVLDADSATVRRWRDSVAVLPGAHVGRVLRLRVTERLPMGLSAAARVLRVHPGPRLSDDALQVQLDHALVDVAPLRIRVERTDDGNRVVRVGDRIVVQARPGASGMQPPGSDEPVGLDEGPDAEARPSTGQPEVRVYTLRGERVDSLSAEGFVRDRATTARRRALLQSYTLTGERRRPPVSVELSIDSLPRDVARQLRDQLDVRLRHLDDADSVGFNAIRTLKWVGPDSLRSSVRIDTLHGLLQIHIVRDTL